MLCFQYPEGPRLMKTILQNPDQVHLLFDQIGGEIYDKKGKQVKDEVKWWLNSKRQSFSGQAYLDQIEKNAVYLSESTHALCHAITKYLSTGEPIIPRDQVAAYTQYTRINPSQYSQPYHLNYLRNGCMGCPVHSEHKRYAGWRELRLAGNWSTYIEEMEFSYQFFQATCIVSQSYCIGLLRNPQFAGIGRRIPQQTLFDIAFFRIGVWASMCINNIRIAGLSPREWLEQQMQQQSQETKKPQSSIELKKLKARKKKWWQFWK